MTKLTTYFELPLTQSQTFKGLGSENLKGIERIQQICEPFSLDAGAYLYRQYESPKHVWFVQRGEYIAELDCADGSRQVNLFGGPGELLGFPWMHDYEYSIRCLTDIQGLMTAQTEFWTIVREYSALRQSLRKRGSQILMTMSRQATINGRFKAHERLGAMLGNISAIQESANEIQLNMTRLDIADFLQLNTDSVSRAFRRLEGKGIIHTDETGRHITILAPQTLQSLADRI